MSPEQSQMLSSVLMLVVMFAAMYFILIRPQKKKEKKLREMIAAIKIGDEVVSIGGIHGKVARIKDDVFVLETGIGTTKSYVTLSRGSISAVTKVAPDKNAEIEVAEIPDEVAETTEE